MIAKIKEWVCIKNMNNCKVTVVVPVFNVEKYLKRCLNSIINQTMKEIEIILVDDGSTDKSGKICDQYKKIDKRIKVIHQNNKGLSAARNVGIKIAISKYICFIDSDDYIENDMIEYLYQGCIKKNADISCCGFTNIYENKKTEKITIPTQEIVFSKKEALDIHMFSGYIDVVAWNKMYKIELFKDIKFPEGKLYEDILTIYKLIEKSKIILLRPDSKYFYCKRNTSIGGQAFSKRTLNLLDACDKCVDDVLSKYGDLNNIKISRIQWYIVVLNKMLIANYKDKKIMKKIRNMIVKNYWNIIRCRYLNIARKVQITLILFPVFFYRKIYMYFLENNR